MKKFKSFKALGITFLVLVLATLAWAGTPQKFLYGLLLKDGDALSTPASGYGGLYVTSDVLYFKTDGGVATNLLSGNGDNTLDNAYDQGGAGAGKAITTDSGAVALSNTDADNAFQLTINATPSAGAAAGGLEVTIGANSTQAAIEFENAGSGPDVEGTGNTWSITKAGALSAASGTFSGALSAGSFYQSAIAAAASGNANLSIDAAGNGTITLGGTSTGKITTDNAVELFGNVDIGDGATDTLSIAGIIDSNVTLDDGTTDSPALTLKDATDETVAIVKKDGGDCEITIAATEDVEIVTGNLAVGNGVPGTAAMDGEDLYVNGDSEFDGSVTFDGAVTANSTMALAGNVSLDDGSGASPNLTFQDQTNETAVFSKADAGFLSITTVAGDGVSILTGNFKVGAGAPDVAQDGEDAYVTGTWEVDGASRFDGAVTLGDAAADDITITGSIAADVTFKTGIAGGADIAVATAAADTAGSTLDLVAGAGGTASADQVGKNGAVISLTGGAGSAKNGAGANDGDGGDVVLTGGAKGGATAGTEVTGIVRVGNPTVGSTKAVNLLAVEGGFEVDGDAKFDGNITGDGATVVSGTITAVADSGAGPDNLTIAQCGGTFYNSQANQSNLPEASTAIGCEYTFVVTHASNYDVNPDDADIILGATDAPGDMLRSATVGDSMTLRAISASQWAVVSMYPASTDWVDTN